MTNKEPATAREGILWEKGERGGGLGRAQVHRGPSTAFGAKCAPNSAQDDSCSPRCPNARHLGHPASVVVRLSQVPKARHLGHPRCGGNRHLILEVTSFSRFEAGTEVTPVVRSAAFAAIAS